MAQDVTKQAEASPKAGAKLDPFLELEAISAELLKKNEFGRRPLWISWHHLQAFSLSGVKLPTTMQDLSLTLSITTQKLSFLQPMLEAYVRIHDGCRTFLTKVFPEVVGLGNDLHEFARSATKDGGDVFATILSQLEGKQASAALELLTDLQVAAKENAERAQAVARQLAEYRVTLTEGHEAVARVQKTVESDDATSMARLAKLNGDESEPESIAHKMKALRDAKDAYHHDVVVAATTPTYFWVFPLGTIAAGTVAGIYGARATAALKLMAQLGTELATMSAEQRMVLSVHEVQRLAAGSLKSALEHTEDAIRHTAMVQNGWNAFGRGLGDIRDDLLRTSTATPDGRAALRSVDTIRVWVGRAARTWAQLAPALADVLEDPYIKVDESHVDVQAFVKKAEQLPKAA